MKMVRFYRGMLLVGLLVAVLAGCGGGGGGKKDPPGGGPNGPADAATQFELPDSYEGGGVIDSDLTLKVYAITAENMLSAFEDENTLISATELFSGKTKSGGTKFTKQITDLNNQSCYIFAVVILDSEAYSAFDLTNHSVSQLKNIKNGIIAGFVSNTNGSPDPINLSRLGGTVKGFVLADISSIVEECQTAINKQIAIFRFPLQYITDKNDPPQNPLGKIEFGNVKRIKIYAVDKEKSDDFINNKKIFQTDWSFTATKIKGDYIKCPLSDELIGPGKQWYIYALIILNKDYEGFELENKSFKDLKNVTHPDSVLFGNTGLITLHTGTDENGSFTLYDMELFSKTNFIVPDNYRVSQGGVETRLIPGNSKAYFYVLRPKQYEAFFKGGSFVAEWTGTGSTSDAGQTDFAFSNLPNSVDGQERHVMAVVSLDSKDFDLRGKTLKNCLVPLGQVALGYAKDESGNETEDGFIKVNTGGKIEFLFVDLGSKFAHLILPSQYEARDDANVIVPMPEKGLIKIYFSEKISEDEYASPNLIYNAMLNNIAGTDIPLPGINGEIGHLTTFIILDGSNFDPLKQDQASLEKAVDDGRVLFGKVWVNDSDEIEITNGSIYIPKFLGPAIH